MAKKGKPTAPLVPLTGKQKSYLRSLAHKLKPVVQVGRQGPTEGVVEAVEAALEQHELIKVKVNGESDSDAAEVAPQLEKATRSQVAQIIGHTVVLYRRRERDPKIVLPRVKPSRAGMPKPHHPAASGHVELEEDEDDDFAEDDDLE